MNQSQHFVQRQVFELVINGSQQGHELQQRVSELNKKSLQPKLNDLFDKYSKIDEVIRLQKVEIDLGILTSGDSFESQIEQKLLEQLEQEIDQQLNNTEYATASVSTKSIEQPEYNAEQEEEIQNLKYTVAEKQLDLLCYYLTTGELPWWYADDDWQFEQQFLQILEKYPAQTIRALKQAYSTTLVNRLVMQTNQAMRFKLIDVIQTEYAISIRVLVDDCLSLMRQVFQFDTTQLSKPDGEETGLFKQVFSNEQTYTEMFWRELIAYLLLENKQLTAQQFFKIFIQKISEVSAVSYGVVVGLLLNISRYNDNNDNKPGLWLEQESNTLFNNESMHSPVEIKAHKTDSDTEKPFDGAENSSQKAITSLLENKQLLIEKKSANEIVAEKYAIKPDKTGVSENPQEIIYPTESGQTRSSSRADKEARYINNAGIILFWPFLKQFFSELDLIDKTGFINDEARQTAVLLLQYLSTGSNRISEHQLTLNKILCGWPLTDPVNPRLSIESEQQAAVDELLQSVISHWSAIKSTSIEGLRSAFIMREGILRPQHKGWLLHIERNAYDILLDRLPWGIGLIKLSWMEKPVYTEW